MNKLNVVGKIDKVLAKQEGVSKAGNEWQKISFILKTDDNYNNVYHFEVFGEELVSQFLGYELGSYINVFFNVKTSEYKERFYTSLGVWSFKAVEKGTIENSRQDNFNEAVKDEVMNEDNELIPQTSGDDDDLPF